MSNGTTRRYGPLPKTRLEPSDYEVIDRGFRTHCWIFRSKRGKPITRRYVLVRLSGRQIYAHRAMYLQEVGPIPAGYEIDHLCRQKHCCRPDHLEAVTPTENKRRSPSTKLNWEKACEIRATAGLVGARTMAARFGVSEFTIYQVRSGVIWREHSQTPVD